MKEASSEHYDIQFKLDRLRRAKLLKELETGIELFEYQAVNDFCSCLPYWSENIPAS